MSIERKIFEKEGLKIENDRVLTYSRLSCPLGCRYCFAEDVNFDQKKQVAYLSAQQLELLGRLPEEVKMIMPGCDTELFQDKKEALSALWSLSNFKKDIAVITRLFLSPAVVKELCAINAKLEATGNMLTLSISLPCMESAKEWEPKGSSPNRRIQTLKNAFAAGLRTMVAIRPLLPTVADEELENIVKQTKDFCAGYYSGPLYLKSMENQVLKKADMAELQIEKLQPPWMPENNVFYKVEKRGQMLRLMEILRKYDKPLFEGAAEGLKQIKIIYEKYRT